MTDDTVFIVEAYKNGERIERIVHTTEADAREDIETVRAPDRIEIEECRVWLGQDERFEVTR